MSKNAVLVYNEPITIRRIGLYYIPVSTLHQNHPNLSRTFCIDLPHQITPPPPFTSVARKLLVADNGWRFPAETRKFRERPMFSFAKEYDIINKVLSIKNFFTAFGILHLSI
jgi:hypothetical protein